MRTTVCFCSALVAITLLTGQDQHQPSDPYSLGLVKGALELSENGASVSFVDKRILRLGDGTAIAVLKLLTPQELTDPKTALGTLNLIYTSFAEPKFVSLEVNKDPKVTAFLLDYLQEKVNNEKVKRQVQFVKEFVKKQTAPSPPPTNPVNH